MKKVLLLSIILLFVVCSEKKTTTESILDIAKTHLGDSCQIFKQEGIYRFSNISVEKAAKAKLPIKESIDKILNATPTEEKKLEVSARGSIYDSYKWDLPNIFVNLYADYKDDKCEIELVIREK